MILSHYCVVIWRWLFHIIFILSWNPHAISTPRIAILSSLAGLSASEAPRAMAARASSPGRATQAKQVKGYKSDEAQSNGPSVQGVGHKASIPVPLNTHVTERATKKINTTRQDGLSELSKDTGMNDSGQSRKEMVDRKMEALSAKWKTRI